ncbi:MAG: ribose 5-phosphate isomerase B [Oligoflexales bacterium]|nr:ribose 5-phosphate isomerase B [Oligoflexales bacterium]
MVKTTLHLASDHAALDLKNKVKNYLEAAGYTIHDHGASNPSSVDYPDYAEKVARALALNPTHLGILICGTGIGMSIAANKFKGIRAALVHDEFTAKASRQHNNANIICLGARVLNHDRALDLIEIWLAHQFEGGRHQKRLDLIAAFEK